MSSCKCCGCELENSNMYCRSCSDYRTGVISVEVNRHNELLDRAIARKMAAHGKLMRSKLHPPTGPTRNASHSW